MKVFNRQELSGALLEPCRAASALALRAMAIAAGAIGDRSMAALVALVDVTAEGGGPAEHNVSKRSFLLSGERISKPREISWTVEAENVGQLQRRRGHEAGIGSIG
jgi:hypothetical protein